MTEPTWAEVDAFVTDHPDGASLGDVGEVFGLSAERVRQIEAIALRKIRHLWSVDFQETSPGASNARRRTFEVLTVREMLPTTVGDIMARFGCSRNHAGKLLWEASNELPEDERDNSGAIPAFPCLVVSTQAWDGAGIPQRKYKGQL